MDQEHPSPRWPEFARRHLREKMSRGRIASRLANLRPCLIGIEAGMATHYVARELAALRCEAIFPPCTPTPFGRGKRMTSEMPSRRGRASANDTLCSPPRPTSSEACKRSTGCAHPSLREDGRDQSDSQLSSGTRHHRPASAALWPSERTFLSPRMIRIVTDLAGDWRHLYESFEIVTDKIETLAKSDDNCRRVMNRSWRWPDYLQRDGCGDRQWRGIRHRAGFSPKRKTHHLQIVTFG